MLQLASFLWKENPYIPVSPKDADLFLHQTYFQSRLATSKAYLRLLPVEIRTLRPAAVSGMKEGTGNLQKVSEPGYQALCLCGIGSFCDW